MLHALCTPSLLDKMTLKNWILSFGAELQAVTMKWVTRMENDNDK